MEENLINELPDEIRVGIFDVARDLLKTDQVQVRVEPGAKKGTFKMKKLIVHKIIFVFIWCLIR